MFSKNEDATKLLCRYQINWKLLYSLKKFEVNFSNQNFIVIRVPTVTAIHNDIDASI